MDQMVMGAIAFESALGRCAVGWRDTGISGVMLPGARAMPGRLAEDAGNMPAFVLRAIEGMRAVLAGALDDLCDIPIDDRGIDDFRRAVYAATRRIPSGSTRSYGEIARVINRPESARDVGVALSRNPTPIIVPCHRVVAANGALTGFSAPGGLVTKRRMLELEGAPGYGQLPLFR